MNIGLAQSSQWQVVDPVYPTTRCPISAHSRIDITHSQRGVLFQHRGVPEM
jgi:hypothetical protein